MTNGAKPVERNPQGGGAGGEEELVVDGLLTVLGVAGDRGQGRAERPLGRVQEGQRGGPGERALLLITWNPPTHNDR